MKIPLPQFWLKASSKRKRLYSAFFVFALMLIAFFAGMAIHIDQKDAQEIINQLNDLTTQNNTPETLAPQIFLNNFLLCLAMFIPLAGLPIGLGIMFSTGIVFRAELDYGTASAVSNSVPPEIAPTTIILLLAAIAITFVCEFASYTIGMTESVWLFRRIIQSRWRELKNTAILIGIVALLLVVGALVESWAITLPGLQ